MKTFLILFLIFAFTITLSSCVSRIENNTDSVSNESIEENSTTSKESKEPKISILTDIEHCFFDSKMSFKIIVDSEDEFTYGNEYYVEYLDSDGSWKRCEKEFSFTEEAYVATFEARMSFTLSDRADAGKEKYRIVMNIHTDGETYTVYSNEFTAE